MIKGHNISGPIVPFDIKDMFPTHEAIYGKGGWRSVETITERNAIPFRRREAGMVVYVFDIDKTFVLRGATINDISNSAWKEFMTSTEDGYIRFIMEPNTSQYVNIINSTLYKSASVDYIVTRSGQTMYGTLKLSLTENLFYEINVAGSDAGVIFSFNFTQSTEMRSVLVKVDGYDTAAAEILFKINYANI